MKLLLPILPLTPPPSYPSSLLPSSLLPILPLTHPLSYHPPSCPSSLLPILFLTHPPSYPSLLPLTLIHPLHYPNQCYNCHTIFLVLYQLATTQACGHRYFNWGSNGGYRSSFGRCFISGRSLNSFVEFQPCNGGTVL